MKHKIGLFLGGSSSEKEISLETGRHVYNSLDQSKYETIPLFVDRKNQIWQIDEGLMWMNTCADVEAQLETSAVRVYFEELSGKIDYAFSALHGKYGEECFPALWELFGIKNNTSGVLGGSMGMDKGFQKKLLEAHGLHVPKYLLVTKSQGNYKIQITNNKSVSTVKCQMSNVLDIVEKQIGFPCIVKPTREGCSVAIAKVNKESELEPALEAAFKYDNFVLVEKCIEGVEVTTTVIEENEVARALTPTETPYRGDFLSIEEKFLPGDSTMITPPNLPIEDIQTTQAEALKAYLALRQDNCARIDSIWNKEEKVLYILEPNSPPGMTPSTMVFHQAAEEGWSATEFFDRVIKNKLQS